MLQQIILELSSFLLGDVGSVYKNPISFDIPARMPTLAEVPSLNEVITIPDPRKGCVIGWQDPSVFPSHTNPMGYSDLGHHLYGGPHSKYKVSLDEIGHVYTVHGGIIDIGHVRDHADLARYLTKEIIGKFKTGGFIELGDDTDDFRINTGLRRIEILRQNRDPSVFDAAVLGAYLSYLVAIWHEIATYKTWQDYSTFSPEDNYSNLLGAYIGFKACIDTIADYNLSVTITLNKILNNQLKIIDKRLTYEAGNFVKDYWYEYGSGLPDFPNVYLFLLKRHFDTGFNNPSVTSPSMMVTPWLVTDLSRTLYDEDLISAIGNQPPNHRVSLQIPTTDSAGIALTSYFKFDIKNVALEDSSLLDGLLTGSDLSSVHFPTIVERIKSQIVTPLDPNAGSPN